MRNIRGQEVDKFDYPVKTAEDKKRVDLAIT